MDTNFKKLCILSLLTALVVSGLIVLNAKSKIDKYHSVSTRALDPRQFPLANRMQILDYFIDSKNPSLIDIVFLGDSQTFGHGYKQELTFPSILNRKFKNQTVINLSVTDARLKDNIATLNRLVNRGIKVSKLFLSLNEAHPKKPEFFRVPEALMFPNWLFLIYPRNVFSALEKERNLKNLESLSLKKHDGYFSKLHNEDYFQLLRSLLDLTVLAAKTPYIYVTPHPPKAIEHMGYKSEELNEFRERVREECMKKDIKYLEVKNQFNDSHFFDRVHLNQRGHKQAAKYFERIK